MQGFFGDSARKICDKKNEESMIDFFFLNHRHQ